jgi:hypothetical protein
METDMLVLGGLATVAAIDDFIERTIHDINSNSDAHTQNYGSDADDDSDSDDAYVSSVDLIDISDEE